MAFYGYDFVFGGVPSETYCLEILNFGGSGGLVSSPFGSDVELITDKIRRNPVPLFYGVEHTPVLTFDLTFGVVRKEPLDSWEKRSIARYMFGQREYKWLEIVQSDLQEIRFKCFFTDVETLNVGNCAYAFSCTVVCDAPWGWSYDYINSYDVNVSRTILFNNTSDDDYYFYPILNIKPAVSTTDISIVNENDNNREFKLSDMDVSGNEIIHVNNSKQIITSNEPYNRFQNFNKNWLRLVSGYNTLVVTGSCNLTFNNIFPRKVGG